MEIKSSEASETSFRWNLGKLRKAERMLKKGFAPAQVGRALRLSAAQIDALNVEAECEPIPQIESFAEWRKRKAEEMERQLVDLMSLHIGAAGQKSSNGLLDPETMGTVKDASTIAYLWLRKGNDSAKTRLSVDFALLANAIPAPF